MSQEELAARAGISRDSVYRAERAGAEPPSLRVQRLIAAVLEVDADGLWPQKAAA